MTSPTRKRGVHTLNSGGSGTPAGGRLSAWRVGISACHFGFVPPVKSRNLFPPPAKRNQANGQIHPRTSRRLHLHAGWRSYGGHCRSGVEGGIFSAGNLRFRGTQADQAESWYHPGPACLHQCRIQPVRRRRPSSSIQNSGNRYRTDCWQCSPLRRGLFHRHDLQRVGSGHRDGQYQPGRLPSRGTLQSRMATP